MKACLLAALTVLAISCNGCSKEAVLPPNVRGVTHIDGGTDYVYMKEPSAIGGACAGWNKLRIARRGDLHAGMDGTACWREERGMLRVTTQRGDMEKIFASKVMLDIKRE